MDLDSSIDVEDLTSDVDDVDDESAALDIGNFTPAALPPLPTDIGEDEGERLDPRLVVELEDDEGPAEREAWVTLGVGSPPGPACALHLGSDAILVAGRSVLRWDRAGNHEELATSPVTLSTVVPTPSGVLATTVTGELVEVVSGTTHAIPGWRTRLGVRPDEALELAAYEDANRVLIWLSSGEVFEDAPDLGRPVRLPTPGPVLAMSHARPRWFVVATDGGSSLLTRTPEGRFLRCSALGAERVLGPKCLIEADEGVVVLARFGVGLVLSTCAGERFSPVAGLGRVTAIAVGMLPCGPRIFVGTYDAAGNTARLYHVDPQTLAVRAIGQVRAADDEEAAVSALGYDSVERTLWAVGGFGVRRLTRPD
jgi:hypothetical protein